MRNIQALLVLASLMTFIISCTDTQGDGINVVEWEGSVVMEDSCYRNPVWEPDLSNPTVFEAAVGFFALGTDNEWSPGLNYTAPVLSSNDLMNWRLRGEAFTTKPGWSPNKITGISAAFARTRATYYVFYSLGNDSLGMAFSRAPQGPFTDLGLFKSAADFGLQQLSDPFFFPFGSRAYVFFNGGDGIYGQELTLSRVALATTTGSMFKVAGDHIKSITITRYANIYYLFGVVDDGDDSWIAVGRSLTVAGPYLDKDGTDMLQGGGTPVLRGSAENGFIATDHIGGVFIGDGDNLWITYHATDIDKPQLSSGTDRHPLMLSLLSFDDEFWPAETTIVKGGWNCIRFTR